MWCQHSLGAKGREDRTSSNASRLLKSIVTNRTEEGMLILGRTAVSSIVLSSSSTFPPGSAVSPA